MCNRSTNTLFAITAEGNPRRKNVKYFTESYPESKSRFCLKIERKGVNTKKQTAVRYLTES